MFDDARTQACRQAYERGVELPPVACPFCRAPQASGAKEIIKLLLSNAEAGRAWAQDRIAQQYVRDWAFERSGDAEGKAIHWLTLAAQQGCMNAQFSLGSFWYAGNSTSMPQSTEKALELLLSAARQGHATAQYKCSEILKEKGGDDDADAYIWCTLAAAQRQPDAQRGLGRFYALAADNDNGDSCDNRQTVFKALYWIKKAALQGDSTAQMNMVTMLLELKGLLFDGVPNRVGYSCIPEALFWKRLALNSDDLGGCPSPPPDRGYNEETCLQSCA
jgi:TPR repeat protein